MIKRLIEHSYWVDDHLDFLKEDLGYETQDEFDQDYKTLCPITLVDFISLEKTINDEIEKVQEWCLKENSPITASHIKESLRLGPLGLFQEAMESRRDKFKEALYPRAKIKKEIEGKKEEEEYFTNSFGIRMKRRKETK